MFKLTSHYIYCFSSRHIQIRCPAVCWLHPFRLQGRILHIHPFLWHNQCPQNTAMWLLLLVVPPCLCQRCFSTLAYWISFLSHAALWSKKQILQLVLDLLCFLSLFCPILGFSPFVFEMEMDHFTKELNFINLKGYAFWFLICGPMVHPQCTRVGFISNNVLRYVS